MKKILISLMIGIFLITLATAESDTSFTFKQNQQVNFTFVCLDTDNNYCSSTTLVLITLNAPNGNNLLSNDSLTWNPTYHNITLPTTDNGVYSALIISPTAQNTTSEFKYTVTPSGFIDTLGFYFILLGILISINFLGFYVKDAWFVVIGGMGLIILGVYSLNSGIVGFRDEFMTLAISLFEIGVGTFLSIGAGLQKMDED